MKHFAISGEPLLPDTLREALEDPSCGGYVTFEGWVRNHADGHGVYRLEPIDKGAGVKPVEEDPT